MVDGFVVFLKRQRYFFTWCITPITYTTIGGVFLMQCFILSDPIDKELRCLVDCREYLQVTTLVDMTSVDWKKIMLQVWQGRLYKRKIFFYSWPRQPPRKHLDWNLWRQTLVPMLHNITNKTWKDSLGRWEKKPSITGNSLINHH